MSRTKSDARTWAWPMAVTVIALSMHGCRSGDAALPVAGESLNLRVTAGREWAFVRDGTGIGLWQVGMTRASDGTRGVFHSPLASAESPTRVLTVPASAWGIMAAGTGVVLAFNEQNNSHYRLHEHDRVRSVLEQCDAPLWSMAAGVFDARYVVAASGACSSGCSGPTIVTCSFDGSPCEPQCLGPSAGRRYLIAVAERGGVVALSSDRVQVASLTRDASPLTWHDVPVAAARSVSASLAPDGRQVAVVEGLDDAVVHVVELGADASPGEPLQLELAGSRVDSATAVDEGLIVMGQSVADGRAELVVALYRWGEKTPLKVDRWPFELKPRRTALSDGASAFLAEASPDPSGEWIDLTVRNLGSW